MAGEAKKVAGSVKKDARRTTSLLEQARHTAHEQSRERRPKARPRARRCRSSRTHSSRRPQAGPTRCAAAAPGRRPHHRARADPLRPDGRHAVLLLPRRRDRDGGRSGGEPDDRLARQACGDAHLDNFGAFGTDQGNLVFDVNDFDETYPAPWSGMSSASSRVRSWPPARPEPESRGKGQLRQPVRPDIARQCRRSRTRA